MAFPRMKKMKFSIMLEIIFFKYLLKIIIKQYKSLKSNCMTLTPFGPVEQALQASVTTSTPQVKSTKGFWWGFASALFVVGTIYLVVDIIKERRKKKNGDQQSV